MNAPHKQAPEPQSGDKVQQASDNPEATVSDGSAAGVEAEGSGADQRGVVLTEADYRDLRKAMERDVWAGEWNSLPTAVDRVVECALAAQREGIARAIAVSMPYNHNLRPDGTEDPIGSAYDEGQRDAEQIARTYGTVQ